MKYDMIIPSIPRVILYAPPVAPSLLKAVLVKNGYKCKVLDWNYDLYKITKNDDLFEMKDISFSYEPAFKEFWEKKLKSVTLKWIDELKSLDTEWIGIPLFSNQNLLFAKKLLKMIRKELPQVKIVVGGDSVRDITKAFQPNVGEYLLKNNLADHYILGEAENAIIHLLQGDFDYLGIDGNPPEAVDVKSIPIPDYSDLDMDFYYSASIIGSRGCINHCKFCDTSFYSKIFRQRKAEDIFEEMKIISKRYGKRIFVFADNLMNGSIKEFRKLSSLLKGKSISWSGQMVCTSKLTEEDFRNAGAAGLTSIAFGIESGSEKVRRDMGKTFTNETLYNTLDYMTKYASRSQIMLIIGWPTETEEDFQQTLDMLTEVKNRNYSIKHVNLGGTCGIAQGAPMCDIYKFEYDTYGNWVYLDNNMAVRVDRWFRVYEHCESIGLQIDAKHLEKMKRYREKYRKLEK